ncbi:MAG: hypothetical protein BRC33_11710 [Cyanobacteria bacterium SW_9_44_58]|nr:MAG: hypothetical protein BRC33_11710 [Cyanobacteria bacterium SW_9_44_58]
MTDEEELAVFSSENLLTLFRDDTSTNDLENASGSVARLRLFDQALSESEISNLDQLPPTEDDAGIQEFFVTNTNDSGNGSLRSAIAQANNSEGEDIITFVNLRSETINLTSGELEITDSVNIEGLGTNQLTVDAGGNSGVFQIDDGESENVIDVAISGLKISGGSVSIKNNGGGIFNQENLTLTDAIVSRNFSGSNGGGIYNKGNLTITKSTISDNSSNLSGGGIYSQDSITITNSTISDNSASSRGGGIFNEDGIATITNSTISGNIATFGGGFNNFRGNANLINSTFSGNSAIGKNGVGGGISNYNGNASLSNSTVSGNSASNKGGGIFNYSSVTSLTNSIVANSTNGDIFFNNSSSIKNQGVNLVEDRSLIRENIINQDPNLSPLQDNGGFTLTQIPLANSPALDTGINSFIVPDTSDLNGNENSKEPIPFDQRGSIFFDRIVNETVDLGAAEVQDETLARPVAIDIADFESVERNDGETATFIFAVNLEEAPSQPLTVEFATTDGTASAGEDYIATSGTLTFKEGLEGLGIKTIEVEILGDNMEENDETFNIQLSNPSNGLILRDSNATGTIVDDNDPPGSNNESANNNQSGNESDDQPNPVPNQADEALKADDARSTFNVDGSGITIGVLSDSFNNREGEIEGIANGNLPGPGNPDNMTPVEVLDDLSSGGTDEGRAMIELMHDVAPGTNFIFHTAFNGRADFAEGINELVEAGADILVDDVFYPAQPFFQDGIVAQAAQDAVSAGVPFFSAAGNSGSQSYESEFRVGNDLPQIDNSSNYIFHDFDPSSEVDTLQEFTLGPNQKINLSFQWDQPSASTVPEDSNNEEPVGSTNDLDLFLFNENGNKRLAQGIESNVETGDPIELLQFSNLSSSQQSYNLAIGRYEPAGGSNSKLIKYINFGDKIDNFEHETNSSTVVGHPNAPGVAGVGAAPFQKTPEFGTNPPWSPFHHWEEPQFYSIQKEIGCLNRKFAISRALLPPITQTPHFLVKIYLQIQIIFQTSLVPLLPPLMQLLLLR